MIKTDKKLSSLRQILAAVEHFEKKDYECALSHSLRQVTDLFKLIRADSARCRPRFRNDLAHYSGMMSPGVTIPR
jgi:hypothetical protein